MAESVEGRPIQQKINEMTQLLSRAMNEIARGADGQSSPVVRDLAQIITALDQVKTAVETEMGAREKQVGALVGVGDLVNSSLGLKRVLSEVMDRLVALMSAERGFLMLREDDGKLKVQVARGMDKVDLNEQEFAISKTIVQRVVESGEVVLTTNAQQDPRFDHQMSIAAYHLLSILCAPLKIKDQLIGVIYVDNRVHTGIFQQRDLGLISVFANQAAVAIDNARLFDGLQASNKELEIAYQATLEGWVRALDLRDKETEGHTKRVTALTLRLAKAMGVNNEDLVHIRRGALLHDIGKMAIPDAILLKPSELTPDERGIVQLHPIYAYQMLSPIKFLMPALDIPYCHHEKWDGSGYPRGLKGTAIPFAARMFTVIDVWDALVSDRPYRRGLKPVDIREYIRERAGRDFDPAVVEAFLGFGDLSVPRGQT